LRLAGALRALSRQVGLVARDLNRGCGASVALIVSLVRVPDQISDVARVVSTWLKTTFEWPTHGVWNGRLYERQKLFVSEKFARTATAILAELLVSVWIVVLKLFWMKCVDVVSSDIYNKD
jgi:hypothetical protein